MISAAFALKLRMNFFSVAKKNISCNLVIASAFKDNYRGTRILRTVRGIGGEGNKGSIPGYNLVHGTQVWWRKNVPAKRKPNVEKEPKLSIPSRCRGMQHEPCVFLKLVDLVAFVDTQQRSNGNHTFIFTN